MRSHVGPDAISGDGCIPKSDAVIETRGSAAISSQVRGGLGQTKHVELRCMYMQRMIKDGRVQIGSSQGPGTAATSALSTLERRDFEKHRAEAGVRPTTGHGRLATEREQSGMPHIDAAPSGTNGT